MINALVKHIQKQPVSTVLIAAAGVAATVAVARSADELPHYARSARRRAGRLGEQGAALAHRGREATGEGLKAIRERAPDVSLESGSRQVQHAASRLGVQEKTLAVFLATVLAKSATGFLRWRSEQKARLQAEALASDEGEDFETQLEEQTVAELRKQASELDIAGRSSMNKDELVDALKG